MIKKLRRKFIMISMGSTILVVSLLVAIINMANFYQIGKKTDGLLNIIIQNGGTIPDYKTINIDHGRYSEEFGIELSEETKFETRYFTVNTSEGQIASIYTGHIAAVSAKQAQEYARTVLAVNKTKGYLGVYKYMTAKTDTGNLIAFLDCRQLSQTSVSFLIISVLVSSFGLLAIFLLILVLSKHAIKPFIESMNKQKQFITDAGHEIKTPLAIISANTDVIELGNGENEWTKSIKNQIKRLDTLIKNLLTLSKMEEDNVKVVLSPFSISEAVCDSASEFKVLAESSGKRFETDIDDDITINGNESSVRQLTAILLDNAVKYASKDGYVKVSLKKSGKSVSLCVENSCETPPGGDLSKLFDRFYRDDSSRARETGGYGIGLSIAKAIVDSHKGKITASVPPGSNSIIFTAEF